MLKMMFGTLVALATLVACTSARERYEGWQPPDKAKNVLPLDWDEGCTKECGGGTKAESTRGWSIPCNSFPCDSPLECQCGNTDLVFVMDNTGSITQKQFWIQKQFVNDVATGLAKHGGEEMSRSNVGLVSFDNTSVINFDLSAGYGFSDLDRMGDKVWNTLKKNGYTNTAAGLASAMDVFALQQSSNKKVAILLTDGASNIGSEDTVPNAEVLQAAGIGVYVVGIGIVNEVELKGIASKPTEDFYFYAADFTGMENIISKVINGLCCSVPDPTCEMIQTTNCSVECDGGVYQVTSECQHYGFGNVVVKKEIVVEEFECNMDPCPTTVTCSDTDVVHEEGDAWYMTCVCTPEGVSVCEEAELPDDGVIPSSDATLGCGYKGKFHAAGSSWIQRVSGKRKKGCYCPEEIPNNWKVQDYCIALCVHKGIIYREAEGFSYDSGKLMIQCDCKSYAKLQCRVVNKASVLPVDPTRGCKYSGIWHAIGSDWIQDVSGGRKKACACPDADTWSISFDCHAICIFKGETYDAGDRFETQNANGQTQACECKTYGVAECKAPLGTEAEGVVIPDTMP